MARHNRKRCVAGFTLIEMMVVMVIIALLASALLFAMYQVQQTAKEARTRSQIAKIHELLMQRYTSYKTRPIPSRALRFVQKDKIPYMRMMALRDLMRMEMPERKTDVLAPPVLIGQGYGLPGSPLPNPVPAVFKSYHRRITNATNTVYPWQDPGPDGQWGVAGVDDDGNGTTDDLSEMGAPGSDDSGWSYLHQGSECLYLILSTIRDGDTSGLDFFQEGEIADTDGDGMLEIIDGFGVPINFLRWAPGYGPRPGADLHWGDEGVDDNNDGVIDNLSEAGWPGTDDIGTPTMPSPSLIHVVSPQPLGLDADDFDPLYADPQGQREMPMNPTPAYLLTPLIFSAGADREFGIRTFAWPAGGNPFQYTQTRTQMPPGALNRYFPNDPYVSLDNNHAQFGDVLDPDVATDNITNHNLQVD